MTMFASSRRPMAAQSELAFRHFQARAKLRPFTSRGIRLPISAQYLRIYFPAVFPAQRISTHRTASLNHAIYLFGACLNLTSPNKCKWESDTLRINVRGNQTRLRMSSRGGEWSPEPGVPANITKGDFVGYGGVPANITKGDFVGYSEEGVHFRVRGFTSINCLGSAAVRRGKVLIDRRRKGLYHLLLIRARSARYAAIMYIR